MDLFWACLNFAEVAYSLPLWVFGSNSRPNSRIVDSAYKRALLSTTSTNSSAVIPV